jgi:hypothetical protein
VQGQVLYGVAHSVYSCIPQWTGSYRSSHTHTHTHPPAQTMNRALIGLSNALGLRRSWKGEVVDRSRNCIQYSTVLCSTIGNRVPRRRVHGLWYGNALSNTVECCGSIGMMAWAASCMCSRVGARVFGPLVAPCVCPVRCHVRMCRCRPGDSNQPTIGGERCTWGCHRSQRAILVRSGREPNQPSDHPARMGFPGGGRLFSRESTVSHGSAVRG